MIESAEKKWFLCEMDQVFGPFSKDEVEAQLSSHPQALIWGRGQPEWVPPHKWARAIEEFEERIAKSKTPERMWRAKIGTEEYPPMAFRDLIDFLRTRPHYSDVLIWTEGYSEWRDIYQIHVVMDELGVGRRAHPRVPISGQVQCESMNNSFMARALSISEGGLGMTDGATVKIGEKIKIILKSAQLYTPLHATAEVVYVGAQGYAGLKFIGIQAESKSAVIEYVRNYLNSNKHLPLR